MARKRIKRRNNHSYIREHDNKSQGISRSLKKTQDVEELRRRQRIKMSKNQRIKTSKIPQVGIPHKRQT